MFNDFCYFRLLTKRSLSQRKTTMDVTRLSDNTTLLIKHVKAGSDEVAIAQMLSSPERLADPRNHAVPLLDSFVDDSNPEDAFLVMPLLRIFDDPPFNTVGEVLDFIQQMLEVLQFRLSSPDLLSDYCKHRVWYICTILTLRIGTFGVI